jgi:hypothetical protein
MVESRRQAGGRNVGLWGGQRVRHEMFEEVARSQSLHGFGQRCGEFDRQVLVSRTKER